MKYYLLPILWLTALPVMAGSCNSIADDNQRLACFNRSEKCMQIDESMQRLACFDNNHDEWTRSSKPGETVSDNIEPAPVAAPVAAPMAKPVPEPIIDVNPNDVASTMIPQSAAEPSRTDEKALLDDQAFPVAQPSAKSEESPVMEATITAVKQSALYVDYLTLDNGQVWRESSNSNVRFKVGQTVRLTKGALGSNVLTVDGSNKKIKVKRIR